MFGAVYRFEVGYHLRRPITYFFFAVLFLLAFLFASSDIVQVTGAGSLVKRNAPSVIAVVTAVLTLIGQVILTAIVGASVLRDFQYGAHELLFATPLTKRAYLGGRFTGSLTVMLLLHLGIPLGYWLGTVMPWVDRAEIGPFRAGAYLSPFLVLLVPSVVLVAAIFFAVGSLTRRLFWIYTQGIFLLVAYSIAGTLTRNLESRTLAALLDPVGLTGLQEVTRYWSPAERNVRTIPLDGALLANRLLWLGVAALLFALTYALFQFRSAPASLGRRPGRPGREPDTAPPAPRDRPVRRQFGLGAAWAQYLSTVRMSYLSVVRDVVFVAIVTIGIANLVMGAYYADSLYGQVVWPVTYTMAETLDGSFSIFFVILITIYAGEAVWRERQLGLDQVTDALPTPSAVPLLGKLTALTLVMASLLLVLIATGVATQAAKGYYHFELGLYFRYFFGTTFPGLVQLTAVAFLVHTLVNQKYAGHVVMILLFVGTVVIRRLGLEHQLIQLAQTPAFTYSDMNGFGPFVPNLVLSAVYWTGVALVLGVVALLFWVRGTDSGWRIRFARARGRLRRPVAVTGLAGLVVALGAGGLIFYNTNVLNRYRTSKDRRHERAEYERRYKVLEAVRQPRLVDADVRADLEPEHRAFTASGTFTFVNRQAGPLDTLVVTLNPGIRIDTLRWDRPARTLVSDSTLGTRVLRLQQPLAPGDTLRLRYRARWEEHGFRNDGVNTDIVSNGTFVNSQYYPALGYQPGTELAGDDDRRKEKLPPRERMPSLDDEAARADTYVSNDADWITFRATVSTAPDQIAVAPGYLKREYREHGRRVFEYEMDRPILNFYSFVSARYAVERDTAGGVALEIYYHPGHEYDLDRMMAALKAGLAYYQAHFSPYQFRQVRILEFPRYAGFAQAFPNTIPYSESIGFVLRVKQGPDDLDLPFYVTAHELGHQWWAHQVIGANVQGSTLLSEGLANYSALTVTEKELGPTRLKKFLTYELDRYLSGRAGETKKELPLMRVENQGYIHYNKGSLALYALRDLIGEPAMNAALSAFLRDKAFQDPPYTTSREFMTYLERVTPDSVRYALDDLFRTITLWDFRAEDAVAERQPDGSYRVSLRVGAKKVRADSVGNEREVPVADLVDVGVFGAEEPGNSLGRPLYLRKHWIRSSDTTFVITVAEAPRKAGLDPYNKLIDRDPKNNVRSIDVR